MTSYNEINGIPAIVNDEVRHVLKGTYGLPGHVVCDGGDFSQTVNDHHFYQTHGETLANGLKAGVDCFTDDGDSFMLRQGKHWITAGSRKKILMNRCAIHSGQG